MKRNVPDSDRFAYGFSLKIRYKISDSFKFNQIYTLSRVKCAEYDEGIEKTASQTVLEL